MKLTTKDAQCNMVFSWNCDVGSANGDDDGDNIDFEHPGSDGTYDIQGKNYSKSSESEVVCIECDSDIAIGLYYTWHHGMTVTASNAPS